MTAMVDLAREPFPIAGAERLAGALRDARVEVVEDSLALVPEDQPERLAALISGWAERRDAEAGSRRGELPQAR